MKVCLIEEIFNVEEAANVCGIMGHVGIYVQWWWRVFSCIYKFLRN
jgi:hypothetical protein